MSLPEDEEELQVRAAQADDEEPDAFPDIVRKPPRVTTAAGASPLVASAPSDAEPPSAEVPSSNLQVPTQTGVPVVPVQGTQATRPPPQLKAAPAPPELSAGIENLDKENAALAKYGDELDKVDAHNAAVTQRAAAKEQNSQRIAVFKARGIQHYTDPESGLVVPVRDEQGNVRYSENTFPTEYDSQGRAVQRKRNETGAVSVKLLDANAKIGTHPETPNILYRQNKNAGWDYLGTVDEGLQSSDPAVKGAAEKARLHLDKTLHAVGSEALGQHVYTAAEALKAKLAEVTTNSAQVRALNAQIAAIPDAKLQETTGGFLGTQIGSQPSQGAVAAKQQRADLEAKVEALRAQGYTGVPKTDMQLLKDAKAQLASAHAEHRAWGSVMPRTPGELDKVLEQRQTLLAANGVDPSGDPVLAAVLKRKADLGLVAPPVSNPAGDTPATTTTTPAPPLVAPPDHAPVGADVAGNVPPSKLERLKNFAGSIFSSLQQGAGELLQHVARGIDTGPDWFSRMTGTANDPTYLANLQEAAGYKQAIQNYGQEVVDFAKNDVVDPKLAGDWEAHVGRFIGGAWIPIAAGAVGGPGALFPILYAQGHQGVLNDAAEREAAGEKIDQSKVERAAVEAGALNTALGVAFEGMGRGITGLLSKPVYTDGQQAIREAIVRAYQKGGMGGVQKVVEVVENARAAAGKTINPGAAKAMLDGFEEVQKDVGTTLAQRIVRVLGTAARDASVGAGVQAGQNVIARQYDPSRELSAGVGEAAAGFGIAGGLGRAAGEVGLSRLAARDRAFIEKNTKPGETPAGAPKELGGGPRDPTDDVAAHAEIDGLTANEVVAPEQVAPTQTALRGLVKIAQGQPMESLTAAERQAVTSKHEADGLPRVEMVKGPEGTRPVITQAALDRVGEIAPTVRQLLPADEQSQRQAVLAEQPAAVTTASAEKSSPAESSQAPRGTSAGDTAAATSEQPTFVVEVQNAKGETSVVEVQAKDATAAHAQVAGKIPAGTGLIRSVEQVAAPVSNESGAKYSGNIPGETPNAQRPTSNAEVGNFEEHAVAQVAQETGRTLKPAEEKTVRGLARQVSAGYDRWKAAFSAVKVTLASAKTGGASLGTSSGALTVHLPDIAKHLPLYQANPRHGENIMAEEAIHAVTTKLEDRTPEGLARGPIDLVKIYRALPEKVRAAMKGAYKVSGEEWTQAHEFWRMFMQGQLELARGGKIKLKGKFLQEQSSRKFVVENKRALGTLMRYFRDMEGELRRKGTGEEVIAEVGRAITLLRAKVKEVDAHAAGASEETSRGQDENTVSAAAGPAARGPPGGETQPEGSEGSATAVVPTGGSGRTEGETGSGSEAVAPAAGSGAGEELTDASTEISGKGGTAQEIRRTAETVSRGLDNRVANDATDQGTTPPGIRETFRGTGSARTSPASAAHSNAISRSLGLEDGAIGSASRISQNGTSVEVVFVAQEAAKARPSHDSLGRATPGYDQALQPRDRSLPVYRKQSQNIANGLDFAQAAFFPDTTVIATTSEYGAPVMTLTGDTLIGNGREIGIKAAYESGSPAARNYKRDFVRNARKFGIDPAAVMAMPQPILKRVIVSELSKPDLVRFSQESNSGPAMASNALETAAQDASRITPGLLSLFDPNYALDSARNGDFVKAYTRDVIRSEGANEANLTKSDLTRRIRTAIFAHAYGMDETGRAAIERLAGDEADAGGKTITGGLLTVAPLVARLRSDIVTGDVAAGYDIAPALTRATQDIASALQNKPAGQSLKAALSGLIEQGSLFSADPMEQMALIFLTENRTSRTAIEQGISHYVEAVYGLGNPKHADLFGERALPAQLEMFRKAAGLEANQNEEIQPAERGTPEAAVQPGENARGAESSHQPIDESAPPDSAAAGEAAPAGTLAETIADATKAVELLGVKAPKRSIAQAVKAAKQAGIPITAPQLIRHAVSGKFAATEELHTQEAGDKSITSERADSAVSNPPGETEALRPDTGAANDGGRAEVSGEENGQEQIPLGDSEVAPIAERNPNRATGVADFGEKIGGARKDLADKTGPKTTTRPADDRPGWLKKYHVFEDARKPGEWAIGLSDGSLATRETFPSEAEAEKMVPLIEVAKNHRVTQDRTEAGKTATYSIQRQLGPRKVPTVKGGFVTREEAMRYMAEHPEEIINHKFAFPEKPWLDRIERTGPERRNGNVSPAQFQEAFGFRGGEFGNWNMGSDGQAALNHAYDALHDLADSLGIAPRALSLNGDLAIAFGARGQGLQGARAHYERDYAVINLTKIKGAGSAAHEWFHAFDHYLARQDTKASSEKQPNGTFKVSGNKSQDYVSHGFGYKSKVREELRGAFKSVMDAMVRKNVTGEIDQTLAQKNEARMNENVRGTIQEIRRSFDDHYKKDRSTGRYETQKAPAADLARFDALAEKIAAGDVGEKVFIAGKSAFSGRQSYQAIEDLNAIYKEVTGRSFATNGDGSMGKQLYWQINSMRDAVERLKQASEGVTEVKARPTDYFRESRNIDNFRASDYWSTPHEMGARSFESFVHDKLATEGRRSDYLAHGVENKFYRLLGLKPYPEGAEREALNAAWQKVFDVVQQRETERGTELHAQRLDPDENPELDLAKASDDAEKTIAARFQEARELALKIAGRYANIPGIDLKDAQQHALMALARASKSFDASRGIPFSGLARVAVNNELRGLYRGQMRKAGKEDTTLDVPIEGTLDTAKDEISDRVDVRSDVQRAEGYRMLHAAIDELPERMQDALRGILNGESLEEIGQRQGGISRQAVGRLATEAMRRVRGKLGERGVSRPSDLMSQAITPKGENDAEYSKSSTQVTLAPADAKVITDFAKTIPESDLYIDPDDNSLGREDEPHVTVLYGITQSSPNAAAQALLDAGLKKVGIKLGKLSLFKNEKYDVLKADIESRDLRTLNKALTDSVPFESDFPDYHPHMTIAYLKPGHGAKYVGKAPFTGRELHFNEVEFRGKDGRIHGMALETPLTHALDQAENLIKAQSTGDPIAELMALLDMDAFGELHQTAAKEERGKFTVGRPDLAMGAGDAVQRATDQHYTDTFQTKTRAEMEAEADALLAKHGSRYGELIAQRWLSGDALHDSEVIAAKRFMGSGLDASTPEGLLRRFAVGFAYRNIRGQAARDLAAGFDPHKTPEERNREFLTKTIGTLSPAQEKKIADEPDPKKRRVMLDAALRAKVAELEKATGASLEEILSGGYELHGKGAKIIEGQLLGYDVREQHALKLAQTGTRTAAEIAKMSGVGEKRVREIVDKFLADLETTLTAKVAAGLTLEKMDMDGALFAQEANAAVPAGKTPEEIKAEVQRIIRGMGFVPSAELGKYKVAKKKRATIYRPPAVPYTGRVPDDSPVPFEERTQNQIPFTPEQAMRNVNPKPGDQVAEPTGRVLGQMGLPLYQEMMIRKGADLGNVDDVVKLARVARAGDGNAFDMIYEAWINGILSGPMTHIANITGNVGNAALDFSLQRGMEALVNLAYREPTSPQFGEFKYIVKGMTPGFARAFSLATRAWSAEADFFRNDVLNQQVEMFEDFDKGGGQRPSIPGRVGQVIRIPGRALLAEDAMFKGLLGQMEVGAQAYRIAKAEGLAGEKLSERINQLVATPDSLAWQRAVDKTEINLFQEKSPIGEIAGGIKAKVNSPSAGVRTLARIFSFFFPFNNVPANIFKIGTRKSPLGAVSMLYHFANAGFYKMKNGKPMFESYSKARQVRDIAEQLIAWTTLGLLWAVTEGDGTDDEKKPILFTGSVPFTQVKKGERDLGNRATGGAYQLRLGGRNGTYFNYGRVEPFATVIGTVVDMIRSFKKVPHGMTKGEALDGLAGYFLAQAQSKTFLNGFANLSKAAADSDNAGEFLRRAVLQAIVPALIRQPLRNLDPYVRDSKTAGAAYEMLPAGALAQPKIDVYGNKVEKGGNAFTRLFFAAGVKPTEQLGKADALLLNWNKQNPHEAWAPTEPVATYTDAAGKNHHMTAVEKRTYLERAGKDAVTAIRNLGLSRSQIERPRPEDLKMVKEAFQNAHEQVKREMFPKYGGPVRKHAETNVLRDFLARAA